MLPTGQHTPDVHLPQPIRLPAGLPGQGKKRPSVDVQGNVYESSVTDQISLESGFSLRLNKFTIFLNLIVKVGNSITVWWILIRIRGSISKKVWI